MVMENQDVQTGIENKKQMSQIPRKCFYVSV